MLFALLLCLSPALNPPPLKGHINDYAGLLEAPAQERLEKLLTAYEARVGHQFAVLIVPSLEGDPLEDFSIRVADAWKLGSKKSDNGLLLLIAPHEHQARIEVGRGLEGVIPDAVAAQVIRQILKPAFRQQDFAGGIEAALKVLMQAGAGEKVELPNNQAQQPLGIPLWLIILLFLLAPPFMRWFGLGMLLGGGFRGGGGFGGGGGGFSGGGGGFSGGGASGSW